MSAATTTARRLLERTGEHPVVSVFVDLDPEQFSTAPARATQLTSLLDEADRATRGDTSLDHADREAVKQDLQRLQDYLQSDDPPISGARALAVFCSGADDLFEAVPLTHAAPARIVIARRPYVEPLVAGDEDERWCVALVNRNTGRIFEGEAPGVRETVHRDDDVHGQHRQGGWSQARYERSVEEEIDTHLRTVADQLYRHWQRRRFGRLVLGGPVEVVDRFAELLHNDLRPALSPSRISLDVETAGEADVQAATDRLRQDERAQHSQSAAGALEERLGAGSAVVGLAEVLTALGERRVQTLVLERNFQAEGGRCPACGLLYPGGVSACPADGTALHPVADLREAAVETAVLQDADIVVVGEGSEVPPAPLVRGGGIGALLRF